MSKKRKKIVLAVCLLSLVAIIVCSVLVERKQNSGNNTAERDVQDVSSPPGTSPDVLLSSTSTANIANEQGALKYSNDKYGFELYFPETWKDYQINEVGEMDGPEKVISVGFSTDDSKFTDGIATALRILIYRTQDWEAKKQGTKITQNSQYVFSYLTWEEAPSEKKTITEKEIAEVIKTFRLTK